MAEKPAEATSDINSSAPGPPRELIQPSSVAHHCNGLIANCMSIAFGFRCRARVPPCPTSTWVDVSQSEQPSRLHWQHAANTYSGGGESTQITLRTFLSSALRNRC